MTTRTGTVIRPAGSDSYPPAIGTAVAYRLAVPTDDLVTQDFGLGLSASAPWWPGSIGNEAHLRLHGGHTPWRAGSVRGVVWASDHLLPDAFGPWLVAHLKAAPLAWIRFWNFRGAQYDRAGRMLGTSTDQHFHCEVEDGHENEHVTLLTDYAREAGIVAPNPLIGADWSRARPDRAQLDAGGVGFAVRYVLDAARDGGKRLTLAEAQTLTSWGRKLVCNYEYETGIMSGGSAAGVMVARIALAEMRTLKVPLGRPCLFSDDQPGTPAASVVAFINGADGVMRAGGYRAGVYGGLNTITAAFNAGYRWLWQTLAWSGNPVVWHPGAVLRQVHNGAFTGWDGDLDFAQVADFGQWDTSGWTPAQGDDVSFADNLTPLGALAPSYPDDIHVTKDTVWSADYALKLAVLYGASARVAAQAVGGQVTITRADLAALKTAVGVIATAVASINDLDDKTRADVAAVKAELDLVQATVDGGLAVVLDPDQLALLAEAIGVSPQMIVNAVKQATREGSGTA